MNYLANGSNHLRICRILFKNDLHLASTNYFPDSSDNGNIKPKLKLTKPKKSSERFQKVAKNKEPLQTDLTVAVDKLAKLSPKNPSLKSSLLKKLEEHSTSGAAKTPSTNFISSLFSDLQLEKRPSKRSFDGSLRYNQPDSVNSVEDAHGLFDGPDMGIFTATPPPSTEPPFLYGPPTQFLTTKPPSLYAGLKCAEDIRNTTMPARNGFEEMLVWTREGKTWNFPIDNEQGTEEEAESGFHEHVFLDRHLQGLPDKQAIRIFMDLVLNGLSRNPYMRVREKVDTIEWYVRYFKEHEHLILDEVK